jgi:hypothetical protein
MDRTGPRDGRTDDLSWARATTPERRCFFCRRPGATGDTILGGNRGTKVPCCPAGQGCKDGRIYHGPPAFGVHWPDEPCDICPRDAAARPRRGRPASNPMPTLNRTSNISRWHR